MNISHVIKRIFLWLFMLNNSIIIVIFCNVYVYVYDYDYKVFVSLLYPNHIVIYFQLS